MADDAEMRAWFDHLPADRQEQWLEVGSGQRLIESDLIDDLPAAPPRWPAPGWWVGPAVQALSPSASGPLSPFHHVPADEFLRFLEAEWDRRDAQAG